MNERHLHASSTTRHQKVWVRVCVGRKAGSCGSAWSDLCGSLGIDVCVCGWGSSNVLGATWKWLESVEKGDVLGIDAKKHEQDAHAAPNPDLGRVGAEHAAIGRRLTHGHGCGHQ